MIFTFSSRLKKKGKVSICAIMKNEARNVLEWIAYHRVIGVEKFYLYDNNSSDNIRELLDPLISNGIVEFTHWPHNPGQLEAYNDFASRFGSNWEWTCFIDLDEFINIFDGSLISEWVDGFSDTAAIAIQWMNYGPSGHEIPPVGSMISAYRHRLPADALVHGHIKCVVRMAKYQSAITPHTFRVDGTVVDENGREIVFDYDYAIQPIIEHKEICLNHYYTRSRAEWFEKVERGMADSAADAPNRRNMSWFNTYEQEAVIFDDRILIRLEASEREKLYLQSLR